MKKTKVTVLVLVAMLTFAFAANSNLPYAFAHQTKQFGSINIEVGWADEPSLAGQLNTVIVGVSNASDNSPVPNAVAQLQATIKKGGETKPIDLVPQEQEGFYGAQIIPGQIGQYELVLNGTVNGQSIDGSIPLDDVSDPKELTFPSTAGSDNQLTSNVMGQISNAITDLAS